MTPGAAVLPLPSLPVPAPEVVGRGTILVVDDEPSLRTAVTRALQRFGFKVFVAVDGKMARREVQVGDKLTESAIVKAGLEAGQKVVVGPAGALKDGAALPEYLRTAK